LPAEVRAFVSFQPTPGTRFEVVAFSTVVELGVHGGGSSKTLRRPLQRRLDFWAKRKAAPTLALCGPRMPEVHAQTGTIGNPVISIPAERSADRNARA
jgi:hypothetical protein